MFTLQDIPTEEELCEVSKVYPTMNPQASVVLLTLLHLSNDIMTEAENYFSKWGLSSGRFMVLMLLKRHSNQVFSPSELADRAGVTRATMSGLLDRLYKDGMVTREMQADDRRSITIHLTEKSRELLRDILPEHFERMATLMGRLNEAEKKTLVNLLHKVKFGMTDVCEYDRKKANREQTNS